MVTIINSKRSSTRSKLTPKTAVGTKNAFVQDAPPTFCQEINEDYKSLSDAIRQIVKERLTANEKKIKALINLILQATNEILIKIATEMDKLP